MTVDQKVQEMPKSFLKYAFDWSRNFQDQYAMLTLQNLTATQQCQNFSINFDKYG